MLRRFALALVLVGAAGCGEAPGPGAGPAPEPGAEQEPGGDPAQPLPDSICENTSGGNPGNLPRFVDVEVASGERDSITFAFQPDEGAPNEPPLYFLNFTDKLVTDGEGRSVNAEGEVFVVISFQAVGVDLSGETPVEVYTGPKRFTPRFGVLREAVHLGDFESQVSWGLGLATKSCLAIEAEQDHITLEFPTA